MCSCRREFTGIAWLKQCLDRFLFLNGYAFTKNTNEVLIVSMKNIPCLCGEVNEASLNRCFTICVFFFCSVSHRF